METSVGVTMISLTFVRDDRERARVAAFAVQKLNDVLLTPLYGLIAKRRGDE